MTKRYFKIVETSELVVPEGTTHYTTACEGAPYGIGWWLDNREGDKMPSKGWYFYNRVGKWHYSQTGMEGPPSVVPLVETSTVEIETKFERVLLPWST